MTNTGSNTTVSPGGLPSRRNTELAMLVFAVLIPVFAYANVGLAKDGSLPAGMLGYGLGPGPARGRRPHRRTPLGAVRGPADAADRHTAQRHGPRPHLPARPRTAARRRRRSDAADVVDARRRALRGRAGLPQGPPRPPALHLHLDGDRADPADPAGVLPGTLRRAHLDHDPRRRLAPARRVRQDHHRGVLRRLSHGQARRPGAGQPPLHGPVPAARPRPGPDPRHLGTLGPHPRLRDRPGHLAALLRPLRGDALRRDRAHELDRLRPRTDRRRRRRASPASSRTSRAASTTGSTR